MQHGQIDHRRLINHHHIGGDRIARTAAERVAAWLVAEQAMQCECVGVRDGVEQWMPVLRQRCAGVVSQVDLALPQRLQQPLRGLAGWRGNLDGQGVG